MVGKKLIFLGTALFGMVAFCLTGCKTEKAETIAWIDDLPVDRKEAALFAGDADNPESLKKAVEELAWDKYLQGEMVREGALEDASYAYFLEQLDQENQERKEKADAGEILYGPKQYSEKVYYVYRMEQYESQWEEKEAEKISVKEETLFDWYEEDESLYQRFGDVTLQYLSFLDEETEEEISDLQKKIAAQVAEGKDFSEAVKETGCNVDVEERKFTQEDLSLPDVTAYPEISEIVYSLGEGEVSEPVFLSGQSLIFYCDSREDGGRTPFDECKDALLEQYRKERLAERKQEICNQLEIRYAEDFLQE